MPNSSRLHVKRTTQTRKLSVGRSVNVGRGGVERVPEARRKNEDGNKDNMHERFARYLAQSRVVIPAKSRTGLHHRPSSLCGRCQVARFVVTSMLRWFLARVSGS